MDGGPVTCAGSPFSVSPCLVCLVRVSVSAYYSNSNSNSNNMSELATQEVPKEVMQTPVTESTAAAEPTPEPAAAARKPLRLKVDIHTHILPASYPDLEKKFGYGGFVKLEHHRPGAARMMVDGKFFREIEDNCWDCEKRKAECDADGVHVQGTGRV